MFVVTMAIVVGVMTAWAAPMAPYSKASFIDAQKADKPIVVFVHATW
jgi:hypothetical protein